MKNHDKGSFEGKHLIGCLLEFQRIGFIMVGSRVAAREAGMQPE